MEEFQKKYYRKAQFYNFSSSNRILIDINGVIHDDNRVMFNDNYFSPTGKLPNVNGSISYRDKLYLEKVLENAAKKREKRLDILKQRVEKDIEKNQYDKYYQVKNMTEFNLLKDHIKTNLNPTYQFAYCNILSKHTVLSEDKKEYVNKHNLYVNKLYCIIGSEDHGYWEDYERIEFINKQVPVIYGYFTHYEKCAKV
jgi:hypothetical protein